MHARTRTHTHTDILLEQWYLVTIVNKLINRSIYFRYGKLERQRTAVNWGTERLLPALVSDLARNSEILCLIVPTEFFWHLLKWSRPFSTFRSAPPQMRKGIADCWNEISYRLDGWRSRRPTNNVEAQWMRVTWRYDVVRDEQIVKQQQKLFRCSRQTLNKRLRPRRQSGLRAAFTHSQSSLYT